VSRIVVISALRSELAPLVKDWSREVVNVGGRSIACFVSENVVAAAGGIGTQSSEEAARVLVERYRPELLISAGLAGAIAPQLDVATVVMPELVVDVVNDVQYRCESSGQAKPEGVLVTAPDVASDDSKVALAQKFRAAIVDMEAAGVARVARENGIAFRCVKAISDKRGFPMPPLGRFIEEGQFRSGAFLTWLAFRPQYWLPTVALGRNSARASRALCHWLEHCLISQVLPAELLH
jgi:adenosylhomocysteine nucleosidase